MDQEQRTHSLELLSPERVPVWEGLLAWVLAVWFIQPGNLLALSWVHAIVVFAPTVVVPLGLRLSGHWSGVLRKMRWLYFPSVLGLGLAYCVPNLSIAGWAALPWLLWTLSVAVLLLRDHLRHPPEAYQLARFSILVGFLYLPVGAAWALADRLGFHPLGFDSTIILLTATHFHYAGFVLPLLAGHLLGKGHHLPTRLIAWGIIAGIPLTAIGIVVTHFGGPVWVESLFALFMAMAGMGLAFRQMGLALQHNPWKGLPILTGSILLAGAMVLAALYSLRPVMPLSYLTAPWMYALHGTMNALACLLLLWRKP